MDVYVSVLMTVFNDGERFLTQSIQSVLDQSYENFELVIVNDGSNDNSDIVIKSFGKVDSRIKYINRTENKGRVYSLNQGLHNCEGEFIFINDADDISHINRIEESIEFYQSKVKDKKRFGLLGTAFSSFNTKTDTTFDNYIKYGCILKKSLPMWRLLIGMPFPHSSFMYSKQALLKCGGFAKEVTAGIDYLTLLKIANVYRVYGINNILVNRIVDGNNYFMQEKINRLTDRNTEIILKWCKDNIKYYYLKSLPKRIYLKNISLKNSKNRN